MARYRFVIRHWIALTRHADDEDAITAIKDRIGTGNADGQDMTRRRSMNRKGSLALERLASSSASLALAGGEAFARSVFVLGDAPSRGRDREANVAPTRTSRSRSSQGAVRAQETLPTLSSKATIGRNSNFEHLTTTDREKLGGIEYRSLKLLRTLVLSYFFGLHLFGVLCLMPWILRAPAKYQDHLSSQSINHVWW